MLALSYEKKISRVSSFAVGENILIATRTQTLYFSCTLAAVYVYYARDLKALYHCFCCYSILAFHRATDTMPFNTEKFHEIWRLCWNWFFKLFSQVFDMLTTYSEQYNNFVILYLKQWSYHTFCIIHDNYIQRVYISFHTTAKQVKRRKHS